MTQTKEMMKTEEYEKYLAYVKSAHPTDFLRDGLGQKSFTNRDYKIITGLQKSGLKDEVINVISQYVTRMQKPVALYKQENLIITVVASLLAQNINTCEEAMKSIKETRKMYEIVKNNIRY